ncbi:MAG TPA: EMC3/TMCO1 family protein [archaeon]|nr:EMC3/TMCO1 family protein [archaeon]
MVLEVITSNLYLLLTTVFAPLLVLPSIVSLTVFSVLLVFILTMISKKFVDQNVAKQLLEEIKSIDKKIKETKDQKENERLLDEKMKLMNKQMKMSYKSLLVGMVFIIIFLPWLGHVYTQPIVQLPFSLPLIGSTVGWLVWYIIVSIPLSLLFRKILGVSI